MSAPLNNRKSTDMNLLHTTNSSTRQNVQRMDFNYKCRKETNKKINKNDKVKQN